MKSTSQRKRRQGGFTLIEILVVVLIVGLLISTVGVNVFGALFRGQRSTAENQIKNFHNALDVYYLEYSRYPDDLDELLEPDSGGQPFMKRLPMDPWDHEYAYDLTSDNEPIVICYGEDGEQGGEDKNEDITSETLGLVGGR